MLTTEISPGSHGGDKVARFGTEATWDVWRMGTLEIQGRTTREEVKLKVWLQRVRILTVMGRWAGLL